METLVQKLITDDAYGNRLYMKRDDLLPFSMGGNKVRIAEAFYQDMVRRGCDSMIIYGSRHSNLCRVLANLCCSRNTKCRMICSHEEGEENTPTNNTHLIEWADVEMIHCAKNQIAQTVERTMEMLREGGSRPYYIYGDKFGKGNEGTAAVAYADAYAEITSFEKRNGWEFDYIFCPSGTGATQSGLICGHLLAGDHKKIVGIMISSRETQRAHEVIADGIADYFAKRGLALPHEYEQQIILADSYRLGGYGRYDERIVRLIRSEYRRNSVPLDPVYTAKAFWGMKEYIRDAQIRDSRILFLHTGGAPLFYDFLAKEGVKESC